MPDKILVVILSSLSLREAVTTSVFNSRWSDLWKHTPNLDFNAQLLKTSPNGGGSWDGEKCKYREMVNSVLQSHKAPSLKEFRISLYVTKSAYCIVNVGRQSAIVLEELLKESRICWVEI